MAQDAPGQMNDTYIAPVIDDDWLWERRCTALRSGLIREFNETRAEHLRIIRCEIPAHEEIYGFSPESLSLSMSQVCDWLYPDRFRRRGVVFFIAKGAGTRLTGTALRASIANNH